MYLSESEVGWSVADRSLQGHSKAGRIRSIEKSMTSSWIDLTTRSDSSRSATECPNK
jgi:hypothetical protein